MVPALEVAKGAAGKVKPLVSVHVMRQHNSALHSCRQQYVASSSNMVRCPTRQIHAACQTMTAAPAVFTAGLEVDPEQPIRPQLPVEMQESWASAASKLKDVGFELEEADRLLGRAFGWTTQAFWRRDKINELPTEDQIEGALSYLQQLGIEGADLKKVVTVFPEVLACNVEDRLQANVAQLEKQYRMTGQVLTKALLRKPQVLGYTIDCLGDCIGECNRCWARF